MLALKTDPRPLAAAASLDQQQRDREREAQVSLLREHASDEAPGVG